MVTQTYNLNKVRKEITVLVLSGLHYDANGLFIETVPTNQGEAYHVGDATVSIVDDVNREDYNGQGLLHITARSVGQVEKAKKDLLQLISRLGKRIFFTGAGGRNGTR